MNAINVWFEGTVSMIGMTENEQKQQLSVAYIHAVAARAGYACQVISVDDDSVDVQLAARGRIHTKRLFGRRKSMFNSKPRRVYS